MRERAAAVTGDRWSRLLQRVDLLPSIAARELPRTLILYVSGVASGMAPFALLNRLVSRAQGWADLALEVSRGMPHNPTTEMDLLLWEAAERIRGDPESLAAFRSRGAEELAALFLSRGLPDTARQELDLFMETYGDRGLAELDLGRPRWREGPRHARGRSSACGRRPSSLRCA